jgi:hypothetical protein
MKAIPFLMTIPGAIVLFLIGTGIYQRARRLAPWSRHTCIVLSVMIISFGVLTYLRKFERASFSETAYFRLSYLNTWIGGMIIGSFFTVVLSGEVSKLWRRTSPPT